MNHQQKTVSVIGGHQSSEEVELNAYNIGKIIAKVGGILTCGGLSGVMKAAAQGAKEAGGITIGILPGNDKSDANEYIDIALPTTIGFARNVIVAASADVVVALPGSHGTSSEISYALVYGRPVIDLGNWNKPEMIKVIDLNDFEAKLIELLTVETATTK